MTTNEQQALGPQVTPGRCTKCGNQGSSEHPLIVRWEGGKLIHTVPFGIPIEQECKGEVEIKD